MSFLSVLSVLSVPSVPSQPSVLAILDAAPSVLMIYVSFVYRLALYVYEYLLHVGAQKAAQTFLSEVTMAISYFVTYDRWTWLFWFFSVHLSLNTVGSL